MRGDATLQARLLLRGVGLAGLAVAVAGATTLVTAYQPWYHVVARLTMLGSDQDRAVAELAGWQAHPWGWVVPALGLIATIVGIGVAIDRPVARSRAILLVVAGLLALAGVTSALVRPPVGRFDVAGSRLRQLAELADRLPTEVELAFAVRAAPALWVSLVAAVVIAVVPLVTRELP